ncbi:MAG: hypothetical protein V1900_02365 [Candidatus Aenigmatarchaeota archaeon]
MVCSLCGEEVLLRFLRRFAFKVNKRDFNNALLSTRRILKNNGEYREGLFFKTIFDELNRSVDWRTSMELENEFLKILK